MVVLVVVIDDGNKIIQPYLVFEPLAKVTPTPTFPVHTWKTNKTD
jgi:hypothetical protein